MSQVKVCDFCGRVLNDQDEKFARISFINGNKKAGVSYERLYGMCDNCYAGVNLWFLNETMTFTSTSTDRAYFINEMINEDAVRED